MDFGSLVKGAIRQTMKNMTHDSAKHGKDMMKNMSGQSNLSSTASGGMAHGGMTHMMSPYLFGNKRDFFVLFNEAKITTSAGLAIAIVVSLLFALLSTIFAEFSKSLERRVAKGKARFSLNLIASTFTFAFRIFLHYVAMLIVMTMNVWLIIAVVIGHGLGHFVYQIAFHPKPVDPACEC